MTTVFTCNKFNNPKKYLDGLFKATDEQGRLYIARYENGVSFYTAEMEELATVVESCSMTWDKDSYSSVWEEYKALVAELEEIAKRGDDIAIAILSNRFGGSFTARRIANRAQRVCKLLERGAPELVIDNEKCMLIDSLALHKFSKRGA